MIPLPADQNRLHATNAYSTRRRERIKHCSVHSVAQDILHRVPECLLCAGPSAADKIDQVNDPSVLWLALILGWNLCPQCPSMVEKRAITPGKVCTILAYPYRQSSVKCCCGLVLMRTCESIRQAKLQE